MFNGILKRDPSMMDIDFLKGIYGEKKKMKKKIPEKNLFNISFLL